jgi:hypothetical protein
MGSLTGRHRGETGRIGWLKTSLLVGLDQLFLEFALRIAQLGREIRPAQSLAIAGQYLAFDQVVNHLAHQVGRFHPG